MEFPLAAYDTGARENAERKPIESCEIAVSLDSRDASEAFSLDLSLMNCAKENEQNY